MARLPVGHDHNEPAAMVALHILLSQHPLSIACSNGRFAYTTLTAFALYCLQQWSLCIYYSHSLRSLLPAAMVALHILRSQPSLSIACSNGRFAYTTLTAFALYCLQQCPLSVYYFYYISILSTGALTTFGVMPCSGTRHLTPYFPTV